MDGTEKVGQGFNQPAGWASGRRFPGRAPGPAGQRWRPAAVLMCKSIVKLGECLPILKLSTGKKPGPQSIKGVG